MRKWTLQFFLPMTIILINVKCAIPETRLIEATPDIADILGFSRQNMRKLMLKSGNLFPAPIHEGKSSIWHLANVLNWLLETKQYKVDKSLAELAKMNMTLNACRDALILNMKLSSKYCLY